MTVDDSEVSESSVGLNVIKVGYSHSYSHINWVVKSRNSNLENKKDEKWEAVAAKLKSQNNLHFQLNEYKNQLPRLQKV